MSEVKFTGGEWLAFYPYEILVSGRVSVEDENGSEVCSMSVYPSNYDKVVANAKLIAKAPKMLDVLVEASELIDMDMGDAIDWIESNSPVIKGLLSEINNT